MSDVRRNGEQAELAIGLNHFILLHAAFLTHHPADERAV
jgi:hypothetical protein